MPSEMGEVEWKYDRLASHTAVSFLSPRCGSKQADSALSGLMAKPKAHHRTFPFTHPLVTETGSTTRPVHFCKTFLPYVLFQLSPRSPTAGPCRALTSTDTSHLLGRYLLPMPSSLLGTTITSMSPTIHHLPLNLTNGCFKVCTSCTQHTHHLQHSPRS